MMKVHVFNFFPVYFNEHFNLVYIILKHNIIDTPTQPRSEFEMRLQNLKEKHAEDTPEFKLRVWAKMLVMYCNITVTYIFLITHIIFTTTNSIRLCCHFVRPTGPTLVKTCHRKSRFSRAQNQKVHMSDKRLQQQRAVKRWKELHKRFSMGKMMTWKERYGQVNVSVIAARAW